MTALIFLLMGVLFGVSFVLCGPVECADDPAGYWIAKYLP